jgi:hypothetical protein
VGIPVLSSGLGRGYKNDEASSAPNYLWHAPPEPGE